VPEFRDPVLAKTRQKRSFSMTENEGFGLVFAKTGFINSGTVVSWNNMHSELFIVEPVKIYGNYRIF